MERARGEGGEAREGGRERERDSNGETPMVLIRYLPMSPSSSLSHLDCLATATIIAAMNVETIATDRRT